MAVNTKEEDGKNGSVEPSWMFMNIKAYDITRLALDDLLYSGVTPGQHSLVDSWRIYVLVVHYHERSKWRTTEARLEKVEESRVFCIRLRSMTCPKFRKTN